MHRRDLLKSLAAAPALIAPGGRASLAQTNQVGDWERQRVKRRDEALAAFPYEIIEVNGAEALETWEKLATAGEGAPVVVGGQRAFDPILDNFHPQARYAAIAPALPEVLKKADSLDHPKDLYAYLRAEDERAMASLRESGIVFEPGPGAPVGDWPEEVHPPTGPLVTLDFRTGRPLETVFIVVVPTRDWTTIPAYLRWGGWNANPFPEYHIAALRSWRDRYGAELVGLGFDSMNVRVARKPETRSEALALAREHYAYCNDVVDQGYDTLSRLAASLKSGSWWWFWWD